MSIAIGAYCIDGTIVCADTNVVASDNVVTSGSKISARQGVNGSYVIANSSNDGNAANMLGDEIVDALCKQSPDEDVSDVVKSRMQRWHSGYAQDNAPQMTFILAATAGQSRRIYFCEAPNTVLPRRLGEAIAIGIGARIIDPLLPDVITGAVRVKTSLLLLAYLMYRAKRDLIHLRGSDTNAILTLKNGKVITIPEEEMAEAEKLGPEIDRMLQMCIMGLFLHESPSDEKTFIKIFRKAFSASVKKRERVQFQSLDYLLE